MAKRISVNHFRKLKEQHEKIVMLTAYDAPTAAIAAASGVDLLLVGDSVANTMLGYRNTMALTLEESLFHAAAVRRGAPDAFVVGDMPFMTFQADTVSALRNAARYLQEADCDAVKLEGGSEMTPTIRRMVECGIPVMGHIGLMPQHVMTSGGYKITGKTESDADRLIRDAKELEAAGVFAIVLECMPRETGHLISQSVSVPTIGIGGGIDCDGQVQVVTDLLGIGDFLPKHARRYAEIGKMMRDAMSQYVKDVKNGAFPGPENMF